MSRALARRLLEAGIRDERVLHAMAQVPRLLFVPPALRDRADDDAPLPIGHGQTISQPYVVAFMTEALGLEGTEKVLEVGTGSGYQTAVLALLAREVCSVEIV
ncbi:MAG TPA: protein-L-isoaspartate O-methyltransferase, partial [Anaeromyxobacteraceae bacterium]